MDTHQRLLLELLVNPETEIAPLPAPDLAQLFVDTALFHSSMDFVKEDHWLQNKNKLSSPFEFKSFIDDLLAHELSPLMFLQPLISTMAITDIKRLVQRAELLEKNLIDDIKARSHPEQKTFITQALSRMSGLFAFEKNLQDEKKSQNLHLGLSLYRTFDALDEVFDLSYDADHGMKTDLASKERLYEGAGVGVQSSYSTVLNALNEMNPAPGARIIDLGSGYGRVGLVVGLLRPDMDFVGYEYVPHRVDIANSSSRNLAMSDHVKFLTQDLSLSSFQIPEAEIYYMYDPFSQETYGHVLSQLVEIARHHKIVIVTKGNARAWLMEVMKHEGWPPPLEFDGGNLCLFSSRK